MVDKAGMRRLVRGDGDIRPDQSRLVVSGLFDWLSSRIPGAISAYLAMSNEVDVSPLFERLPGWRWVLPRIEMARELTFRDKDVPREFHPFGMEQPVDAGTVIPTNQIDFFLTPGLAFDPDGRRLGNGGGYYDRVLRGRRRDSLAIGVTVDRRVFDAVPVADHDERVDWLATESGVIQCSTSW